MIKKFIAKIGSEAHKASSFERPDFFSIEDLKNEGENSQCHSIEKVAAQVAELETKLAETAKELAEQKRDLARRKYELA